MMKFLNGMYWEDREWNIPIPHAGSTRNALFIFQKNMVSITWNCMSALERNPTTLPQTETILKGQSVGGISIDDLMQVKNYGDGARKLIEMLKQGSFDLDEQTACALHNQVRREDALTWGVFRNSNITIRDVGYLPPDYGLLKGMAKTGFAFLKSMDDKKVGAIATFLFMSRTQFFHDANKRTSSLMMNGYLMKNGYYPITVMNRDSEEFHTRLTEFYNTGDATDMIGFFARMVKGIYSVN